MKAHTLVEEHIEKLEEHRTALVQRLADITDLIKAGKPLKHGKHVPEVEGMARYIVESLKLLAPSAPLSVPEGPDAVDRFAQEIADEVISNYLSEHCLDPHLLDDQRTVRFQYFETSTVSRSAIIDVSIPDYLPGDHARALQDRIKDELVSSSWDPNILELDSEDYEDCSIEDD